MKRETHEEKWNHLQTLVQGHIASAYPNPVRKDCPDHGVIIVLAMRSYQLDETIEEDPQ